MSLWTFRPPHWIKISALVLETAMIGLAIHGHYAKPALPRISAQCRDGTVSWSRHRSGTCSHHGGVSAWR